MKFTHFLLVTALCAPPPLAAWGHRGHEIVATLAFRDLPVDLAPWFQGQEAVLREHCSDPDAWKHTDHQEGPRHYLDSETYGGPGLVPQSIQSAMDQLGGPVFTRAGQLPWVIQDRVTNLAEAFRSGDPAQVAFQTAILSHYAGDMQVPLHTTVNHDGQLTGQHGVHARWETGLVERLGDWDPEPRSATPDPRAWQAPWTWLEQSHALVESLLRDDRAARGQLPDLGDAYWSEFSRLQGPRVKEQLERGGQRTAQMVLLAWTMAGRPTLR